MSWVAKKTETSARETSVTESSPKAAASSFKPSASEADVPRSMTSIARSGAG